ncbi:MAG: PEP-CTERM sorting domain-containing protein [Rhodanobacter sp.]
MNTLQIVSAAAIFAMAGAANATVVLVQTSDPGFYNDSIGMVLNNTNGGDTSTGYFPTSNDSAVTFPLAPDLTAAGSALGNWLADPLNLNANWSFESSIPNSWAVGSEVAVMYRFDTLGATHVVAQFGVDNGIFVWLDGFYIGGARGPGSFFPGEYSYNLGDLASGTHFLQILLEDHGVTNGYDVRVTADSFIPGTPQAVPEPGTLSMLGLGLAMLALLRMFAVRKRDGMDV